jgi:hypothetical protein
MHELFYQKMQSLSYCIVIPFQDVTSHANRPAIGDVSVTGRTVPSNWRVRRTAMLIIYNIIISSDDHVAAITIRKPARPLTASR